MYNPFQATYRKSGTAISDVRRMTLAPVVGPTPDPCGYVPAQSAQAHVDSGSVISNASTGTISQLGEGRVGLQGQSMSYTINQRTVPWIHTAIRFDGKVGDMSTSSIFPSHSVYINGSRVYSTTQDLFTFVTFDNTYEKRWWQLP